MRASWRRRGCIPPIRSIALVLLLAAGALTGCEREVDLGSGTAGADDLAVQRAVSRAIDATPPIEGNRVTLLRDGVQALPAMFAAMARARDSINLEFYTFEDVRSGGQTLGDVLVERLRHGVGVAIVYDAYGSNTTSVAFLKRLADAGAAIIPFNPNPIVHGLKSPNDRDHRKIVVIDGRIAFVGGINFARVYENPRPAADGGDDDPDHAFWRDTAIRLEGPVVAEVQRVFFDTWSKQGGPGLPPRAWYPAIAPAGDQTVRILASAPGDDRPLYYVWLLRALHAARHSISLSTGYFVPTHQEREELARAARRGVRVRLILPSTSDSGEAIAAGRAAYEDLLEAGARIFEVRHMVLHSKLIVIDGVWMAIGSSNFDRRSAVFNNEIDAIVIGSAAADGEALLDQDIGLSAEIDLKSWRSRPLAERLREWRARLWAFLL